MEKQKFNPDTNSGGNIFDSMVSKNRESDELIRKAIESHGDLIDALNADLLKPGLSSEELSKSIDWLNKQFATQTAPSDGRYVRGTFILPSGHTLKVKMGSTDRKIWEFSAVFSHTS